MARRPTRVVTVEGGIGAGKSSLLAAAEAWFPGLLASGELVVAPEPVALWRAPSGPGGESPLGAYSSDRRANATAFQLFVMATKARDLGDALRRATELRGGDPPRVALVERSPDCEAFVRLLESRGDLSWLQAAALREAAAALAAPSLERSATVYLRAPPAMCLERLRARGREEEVGDAEMGSVLEELHALHESMFSRADAVLDAARPVADHREALARLVLGGATV